MIVVDNVGMEMIDFIVLYVILKCFGVVDVVVVLVDEGVVELMFVLCVFVDIMFDWFDVMVFVGVDVVIVFVMYCVDWLVVLVWLCK